MKQNPKPHWGDWNYHFREFPEAVGYDFLRLGISKDLKRLIDGTPYYSAILQRDGEAVMLTYAHNYEFHPFIPLAAYFKGDVYAKLTGKSRRLWIPEGLEEKVKEVHEKVTRPFVEDLLRCDIQVYLGTSRELLDGIRKADEER